MKKIIALAIVGLLGISIAQIPSGTESYDGRVSQRKGTVRDLSFDVSGVIDLTISPNSSLPEGMTISTEGTALIIHCDATEADYGVYTAIIIAHGYERPMEDWTGPMIPRVSRTVIPWNVYPEADLPFIGGFGDILINDSNSTPIYIP